MHFSRQEICRNKIRNYYICHPEELDYAGNQSLHKVLLVVLAWISKVTRG